MDMNLESVGLDLDWKELAFLGVILLFGLFALLAATGVRLSGKREKREEFGVYFVKLFGLLFVATLAIGIVFVKIDAGARTGAYTILGTIAGYLAGSKVPKKEDGGECDEVKPRSTLGTSDCATEKGCATEKPKWRFKVGRF